MVTYTRPPIVEAVFEVFVEPSTVWNSASGSSLVQDFSSLFPGRAESFEPSKLEVRVGVDGSLTSDGPQKGARRHRLWSSDGSQVVQFGADMCALNILKNYRSFDAHSSRLEYLVASYSSHARPLSIQWLGQRYINKIDTRTSDGGLERYFEIYPKLTNCIHGPFLLQVVADSFDGGDVVLSIAFQSEQGGTATYQLEVYARSKGPVDPRVSAVMEWHRLAHSRIRNVFEASLTNEAKKAFGPEVLDV